jgi:hypothetical protein
VPDSELDGYEPEPADLEAVLAWASVYPGELIQAEGDDWLDEQIEACGLYGVNEWIGSVTVEKIVFTVPRRARARAPRGRQVSPARTAARGSPRRSDDDPHPEVAVAGGVR